MYILHLLFEYCDTWFKNIIYYNTSVFKKQLYLNTITHIFYDAFPMLTSQEWMSSQEVLTISTHYDHLQSFYVKHWTEIRTIYIQQAFRYVSCVTLVTLYGPLCGDLHFQTAPMNNTDTSCIGHLGWFWKKVVFHSRPSWKLDHMGFLEIPFH